jgi:hypothetical protein
MILKGYLIKLKDLNILKLNNEKAKIDKVNKVK